ncbi:monooxygenase [Kocuria dechangensis]|uniref:Monooxygenase n=1 Tax=Kocuria dechangensis TaxID=1176249 RepID=A0A917GY82_9MICC|nr:ArsO family NAD(P)H-dependent flavin-containing monooxygenase [Kocuria dechangensis]GGG60954.1 monooxygenase [Kocuria dechangensis]
MDHHVDVAVVGAGQAGLAAGYYLRRTGLSFVLLDDQETAGGAWRHTWPSLRLFSPAEYSSLPGRPMPSTAGGNPGAAQVIDYLADYEARYDLPVRRPVRVRAVHREGDGFRLETTAGQWHARAVVSATGTWSQPFWPTVPGQRDFRGAQVHSARYGGPDPYRGRRVVVVGGANSGAQIAAELAGSADLTWCLNGAPHWLPDDVDGRELFRVATARAQALAAGLPDPGGVASLGNIVVVPPVKRARDAGLLRPAPMFARFTPTGIAWADGREQEVDAVIWCTGFRPALRHLRPLHVREDDGTVSTRGTASTKVPGLYLLGYGDWTGPGSATLIGVGPTAKETVAALTAHLRP